MTIFSKHCRLPLFVLSLAVSVAGTSRLSANNITYSLSAPSPNGWTLSGSITTDGKISSTTFASTDILSWTWSASNGNTTYTNSGTTEQQFQDVFTQLSTTQNEYQLYIAFPGELTLGNTQGNTNFLTFSSTPYESGGCTTTEFGPTYGGPVYDSVTQYYYDKFGDPIDPPNVVIGTAPVPEPTTLTLLATGLLGLVGFLFVRRRRANA